MFTLRDTFSVVYSVFGLCGLLSKIVQRVFCSFSFRLDFIKESRCVLIVRHWRDIQYVGMSRALLFSKSPSAVVPQAKLSRRENMQETFKSCVEKELPKL